LPLGSKIVDVVVGKPGPVSGINLCRECLYKFHPEQRLIGDKAYVGESQIRTPHKKPKKREITPEQKADASSFTAYRTRTKQNQIKPYLQREYLWNI